MAKKKVAVKRSVKKATKKKVASSKQSSSGGGGGGGSGGSGGGSGPGGPGVGGPGNPGNALHNAIRNMIIAGSRPTGQCLTPAFIAFEMHISVSTVYNHINQMIIDRDPLFKCARGLVWNTDADGFDHLDVERRLSVKKMNLDREVAAVCPIIATSWHNSIRPDRVVVENMANYLMGNPTASARNVRTVYNIIDANDPRNR